MRKKYPFLFIPLFSALAYLVRPDGIEVLLVVFFYVLFVKKFRYSREEKDRYPSSNLIILYPFASLPLLFKRAKRRVDIE